jgi:hypothetical protein
MLTLEYSEQLSELYRLYGIAAHNCCNIEYRIAHLLLGPKWKEIKKLTPERLSEVYERLHSMPLGTLLTQYKQHFTFTEEQISLMKDVLEKRNYLVHRFFGDYGVKMQDLGVLQQMISELKTLTIDFQSASQSLDPNRWDSV